jgi:hypothetical protein
VVLLGAAVAAAMANQKPPDGYYQLDRIIGACARRSADSRQPTSGTQPIEATLSRAHDSHRQRTQVTPWLNETAIGSTGS